ncbi:MAG: zf-TFIIB domain-containing protein [Aeromicrobium sp.]|uniref:TFIIB-type zinc ribbon-containing protein n=1 Tax=Aeromicrobium sp. TaxID=1871063 RepID=UPI002614FB47|nr:zf-TFIIB domain-containing protein [Aeromicrobium sp.]MDF1705470.1 zf-TFIIB domain-containing protein [Aeromicrobium sp.]
MTTRQCPTDGTTLTMSERAGVELDYCPECRGVWLDRGELDKILDRAAAEVAPAAPATPPMTPAAPQPPYRDEPYRDEPYRDDRYSGERGYRGDSYGKPYRRKKKEHWLSELFD